MFSALTQGSSIYLLDKTSTLEYKVGEIIGVSQPKYSFGQNTVDLKVKIDDNVQEFNNLPSINSIMTYNNGKVIISETKQGIQNEVESIIQNRKNILENVENYKKDIEEGESILKQINPQFAKDKEREERLSNLEDRFDNVESKLDKIFELVKK